MIDELINEHLNEMQLTKGRPQTTFDLEEHAGRGKSGKWEVIESNTNFEYMKKEMKRYREKNPEWEYRIIKYVTKAIVMQL
jgi:hypothetical protein